MQKENSMSSLHVFSGNPLQNSSSDARQEHFAKVSGDEERTLNVTIQACHVIPAEAELNATEGSARGATEGSARGATEGSARGAGISSFGQEIPVSSYRRNRNDYRCR